MTAFLRKHFRYCTMNPWNQSTSYACNLKIHRLGVDRETYDKLYDLLDVDEFAYRLADVRAEFAEEHSYQWVAGMNGRSGGYLVLYRGDRQPSGYKSYCACCGQQNYTPIAETGDVCGRCGANARIDYPFTHMRSFTYPGKDVDQYEDFEDWSLDELRQRVELVQAFDRLADRLVEEAVWMANHYSIEDETVYVEQTRKIIVPAG